ncbi:NusA-like transcription termination signal-binding factor [Candidatus Woesearchaeota archaeon]|nr:NusA-like transcription termination signal-binding factor [Candidatus Woesearchaeota archaeon]
MEKIRYDINTMKFISLFESLSGARVKDCIEIEDGLLFVIEPGEMGRAIGKNGSNIKRLESAIKKSVKVVEFNDDAGEFVRALLYPTVPDEVAFEGEIITITGRDIRTRGIIIGRDRSRINQIKQIVGRYFKVSEIKVV